MQTLDSFALFDSFPEPVLLTRDGSVLYFNTAALLLFPLLEQVPILPPSLSEAAPGAVLNLELEGVAYTATMARHEAGDLLVLRREGDFPLSLTALSDQLRQRMGSLMATTQLLAPPLERLGEKKPTQYLAMLNQNLYRMLRMVQDMELMALPEGEGFRPVPLDLAGFCRKLHRLARPLADHIGVAFSYEEDAASLITTGDGALLRRMLLSLLSNSLKTVGEGGQVNLKLTHTKERALLTLSDNGPGLTEEQLATYFYGGSRGDALPPAGTGLGLGLPIVRRIARLHGGAVMAASRPGEGLRVILSLPLKPPTGAGFRQTPPKLDSTGGFSPVLVELSDALPWGAFLPRDIE